MDILLRVLAAVFLFLWMVKFFILATKKGVTEDGLGCLDLAGFWALCYFTWSMP